MNPTSIENHLKLVLGQWMIIIAIAWICGRLGRKVGQPMAVKGSQAVLTGAKGTVTITTDGPATLYPGALGDTAQAFNVIATNGNNVGEYVGSVSVSLMTSIFGPVSTNSSGRPTSLPILRSSARATCTASISLASSSPRISPWPVTSRRRSAPARWPWCA